MGGARRIKIYFAAGRFCGNSFAMADGLPKHVFDDLTPTELEMIADQTHCTEHGRPGTICVSFFGGVGAETVIVANRAAIL